jgi:hypothetical protein
MTENEAIKGLETSIDLARMCTQNYERKREIQCYEMAIKALEEVQQYRAIGTPEECRAAMEKQKAKKPMHVTNSYFGYQKHKEHVGYCSDCGHQVEEPYGCPNCLRKIDWGDEE